jgi:hypothetical protein
MNRRRHRMGAALIATTLLWLLAACGKDAPIPPIGIATKTPAATTTAASASSSPAPTSEVPTTGPGQQLHQKCHSARRPGHRVRHPPYQRHINGTFACV